MQDAVFFRIEGRKLIPAISMPVSATILDLKQRIETLLDVKVERQTLKYNEQMLMNDQTISSYSFEESAAIVLEVAPPAGEPEPEFDIVVNYGGEQIELKATETTLVGDLRGRIERRLGTWGSPSKRKSPNRLSIVGDQNFMLYRLRTEMEDDFPLSAYYVYEGSEIKVKMK